MSLWKIFMIIFGITSILFNRCASHSYFGVRNMAKSDVRWLLLNAGGRKTLVGQVSESKSTVNIPSRGLFYPDDMFFTNGVSSEVSKEDCSADRPSLTSPSGSISKCTLKTNNDEKPTKYKTTIGQQKSTCAVDTVESSSGSRQKSTSTVIRSSSRQHKKSSLGQQQNTTLAGHQNPTSDRQKSTRGRRVSTRVQKTSAPRLWTPRVQLSDNISDPLQKSLRGHRISTTSVRQQKSTFILKNSSRRSQKSSSRVQQKSSREQRKPMRNGSNKFSATTTFPFKY